ncbi:GT2 family glycosyltransferase [Bradyrhizobium sp. USDA 4524]|uniref:rhamnan synthesis F family protein n=1 Tax=unclassified Bradyrhizobium TaxID=2631580 RepID=UPI0020A17434|nr:MULTISPECIES: rhamnan synthesis F family protein [unclassified Bradyrhizobium]MCP1845647.1 GT2 family glycosyltransferase [Bradyrhizobium sp. USDA 4538]MCP1907029.1 GT2 family glycosyltransferase [Bradyrhizobium sp. USDA 4537]MCP1985505.1 GT2 family glycosyltransferase [Bradyrhizobium sp. USDA 4539]
MTSEFKYEIERITPEFDSEYYLNQVPELRSSKDNPILHYLEQGWRELRDPSPNFSTRFYLDRNSDVRTVGINPFVHYIIAGRSEGRFGHPKDPRKIALDHDLEAAQIAPFFDRKHYCKQVPELSDSENEALLHYVRQGWRERLDPSPEFSTSHYLESNPDVKARDMNPLLHYVVAGRAEHRQPKPSQQLGKRPLARPQDGSQSSPQTMAASEGAGPPKRAIDSIKDTDFFDIGYYRRTYEIVGDDAEVILDYLRTGRKASPYFDPDWYRKNYPDVGAGLFAPLCHYSEAGRSKGHRPSPNFDGSFVQFSAEEIEKIIAESGLFDPKWYLHRNADVARAGADPLKHYAKVGHQEYKRSANALFDNTYYLQQAIEVRERKWHPLVHYILVGSKRSLSPHLMFDVRWVEKRAELPMSANTLLGRLLVGGLEAGIGPNEYFDPSLYLANCPQAKNFPGGTISHFLEKGWSEGLDPSERFSTTGYGNANPDVREMKANPLLHFLDKGRDEGRNPKPTFVGLPPGLERFSDPEYGGTGPLLRFDAEVALPSTFALSVAVHLHLYYTEMTEEFCSYLNNIPVSFHLFVSVPPGRGDTEVISKQFAAQLTRCSGITISSPDNRGRDIAPFLVEFGRALLTYDIVLHLHSKRSPHSPKHASWRRYLLHYTLGNEAIVSQILTTFYADPKIGLFQPPYHPQVRAQPKWGGNRDLVAMLLDRFGMSYHGNTCPDFPAGSFFWARTDAIRPLLEGRLKLNDFDDEAGQIDGTIAHAIERLLGLVPVLRGYSVACRFIDVAHDLVHYYGKSRQFHAFNRDRSADIITYQRAVQARGTKRGRIAVVTAIIGPFDALLLPYHLEPSIDYFCVTDSVTDGYGVYRLIECPLADADARRSARYIKTNLLRLFPGYDFVVWSDANVLLRAKVTDYVAATEASGCPVGAIPHPTRRSYLEEAAAAVELKLDDESVINAQMASYEGVEGLDKTNLIETNFMVVDARKQETKQFMQRWWNELNKYSRRDQLSINYSLLITNVKWHPLLSEFMSVRDASDFSLFRHGLNDWGPKPHIYSSWHQPNRNDGHLLPLFDEHRYMKAAGTLDLDVVVCVFNALDDVRLCLASVVEALRGRGHLIIVDDASDNETATFLQEFARKQRATIVRHEERLGYTCAANAGVRAGNNRNVLLLNSDTIVPAGALEKLSDALDRDALLGIVGPLSNAASSQSVPSTVGTTSQTAINQLPPGMTAEDMDLLLERIWDGRIVRTPLIHGFCFCVKRSVFERIGFFDEQNFPRGYGEENDFCFRAADAGCDLGVLTSTYVFHAKSKSYAESERKELMTNGMASLIRKHTKSRVSRAVATMGAQPRLKSLQDHVQRLFETPKTAAETRGRLFLLPALRSDGLPAGSGYVRVLLPYRSEAVCKRWQVHELRSATTPVLTAKDTVLIQRDGGVIRSEDLEEWTSKIVRSGARIVYEIDDDLLDGVALRSRGFRGDADDLDKRVRTFVNAAQCVLVSSDALHHKFSAMHRNAITLPNALDGDLWQLTDAEPVGLQNLENRSASERITIGYVGTPTHDDDLSIVRPVMSELQKRFPNRIDFQVIGGFSRPKDAFGSVIQLPTSNDYPSFVRWLRESVCWDIGLIPLAANSFNSSKSYLKFLECAALGMALVCSDGPEYSKVVKHGHNGLLVKNTTNDWLSALSDLITRPDERARLARSAFDYVRSLHTIERLGPEILKNLR